MALKGSVGRGQAFKWVALSKIIRGPGWWSPPSPRASPPLHVAIFSLYFPRRVRARKSPLSVYPSLPCLLTYTVPWALSLGSLIWITSSMLIVTGRYLSGLFLVMSCDWMWLNARARTVEFRRHFDPDECPAMRESNASKGYIWAHLHESLKPCQSSRL